MTKTLALVCYPDSVVLAPGDDPPGGGSQHCDWLLVGALNGARELAADDVLAAVTGRRRHAASPERACQIRQRALSFILTSVGSFQAASQHVINRCCVYKQCLKMSSHVSFIIIS